MTRRGLLLFAAMSLLWGIPYLFIRIAVGELTPATLVFARTLLGAAILVPIALRRGGVGSLPGAWLPLVAFTGIEIGLPWPLLGGAEQHLSSSLTGLLLSVVPLLATVPGLI